MPPASSARAEAGVELRLTDGERIVVGGDLEEVEKRLSDASRSGGSRLAWFQRAADGERVAVNPAHVVSLVRSVSPG